MAAQPDGSYPRLNGKLMQSGCFVDMIVSLVGKVVLFDGNNIELECSDGVVAKVLCEPDSQVQLGSIYEFIGHATMDGSLQVSYGCLSRFYTAV
jgi:Replication factor A protein 3